MKHLIYIFLIIVLVCSCLSGCTNESSVNENYAIRDELVDAYLINDNVEDKLYDFFDTAETSYSKFKKDRDIYQFIQTVYNSFEGFTKDLNANANIKSRIEADREANRYLASYSVDFAVASEPILSLPLEYYENPDNVNETKVFLAINSISQYFCEVDIFVIDN